MPRKPAAPAATPDLTSVKTLITSPTALARHLGMTVTGVSRWFKVNRIPGDKLVAVANYYNVELRDLMPLTGSDVSNDTKINVKPKATLATLLEVYRGNKTIAEACAELGITPISAKLILTNWGDELPTLYTTLTQLDEKRISLDTAMQRLNVTRYTLHNLRAKYGFAPRKQPGYVPTTAKRKEASSKRKAELGARRQTILQVVAGKITLADAGETLDLGERAMWRNLYAVSPVKLQELMKWPGAFREAYAVELGREMPPYVQKWLDFAVSHGLFLRVQSYRPETVRKYPVTPDTRKSLPTKRLLIAVLIGEAPIDEVAASRGADVDILKNLFTSDLRSVGLTFDELMELPLEHQIAMSEFLMATLDRKRKFVEKKV